ncbi:MAG: sigma-70 family RNA polymerase sigma factor, partial [Candidatus Latescibacteria bacterium]|nr:sigma-70 family RNA polymerase sigma factor [Candidatus Latescibacterota bacterium]
MPDERLPKSNQCEVSDFNALVDQYQERILNLCYRFVNHREDAEDVAQDVFVEIYRSIGNFRGDSKLATWIHSIAVRKSLDFIRKKKRKKRFGQVKRFLGLDEAENELFAPRS